MRANPNLPEHREVLQDLLDSPPRITQTDLAEYVQLKEAYDLVRGDLESVRDQIIEMLVIGFPIEPGIWRAELCGTKFVIRPADIE